LKYEASEEKKGIFHFINAESKCAIEEGQLLAEIDKEIRAPISAEIEAQEPKEIEQFYF
jgi:hypothetical protein